MLLIGCSGSDDSAMEPPPGNGGNGEEVTYSGDVKAIIDNNCIQCHANPPQNDAPMSLVTYNNVVDAVNNRGLNTRINSSSNPMPPTGLMSQSNRDIIDAWIEQGLNE
ncbi:hypothetical protein OOZ15_05095 [Galbibacter sp. EGI 63066]|uniref:hypothetical protein n=1 Tax=Galbibacter sp. EGI 63066 TaxID=2993559 RepID=UPI0022487754|nr:hypothetical protein [Galbibacter sp. EGI 63066]MCX2679312.1 hypothetical protein [Galbibacter sp. EGI 63066]